MDRKKDVLEREARWSTPVALATFFAVALILASTLLTQVSGENEAEILRSVHEHSGSVVFTGLLQAVGFGLLLFPVLFLFRAVQGRSPRVRAQLIGLMVAAPLFLAVASGLTGGARSEAAKQFVNGEAKSTLSAKEAHEKCTEKQEEENAKEFREEFEPRQGETPLSACERQKVEEDEAENASSEASLAPISSGLFLAGALGLAVALFYTGLWAMRTGLLSRFWGSLGMASGVAVLLGPLTIVALVWLAYFGLLLLGAVPGGKPPAWDAGEAVPWPTPGEKAAAELEPSEPSAEPEANGSGGEPKRKRKQRD